MTSALLRDFFKLETSDREEKFLTSDVTWQAYESLLTSLGDRSSYRVAYLSGTLEIMSPSRSHEKETRSRFSFIGTICNYQQSFRSSCRVAQTSSS